MRSRKATRAAVFKPLKLNSRPGTIEHRPRKVETAGAPGLGEARERGAAGIRQTEHLGRLVEGLPRRIVQGLSENAVPPDLGDIDQLRVPARHEQREKGEFRRVRLEERREQVPFQVMDGDRGPAPGVGEAAGEPGPDQQRPDEAGTGGIGDTVDAFRTRIRLGERLAHQRQ